MDSTEYYLLYCKWVLFNKTDLCCSFESTNFICWYIHIQTYTAFFMFSFSWLVKIVGLKLMNELKYRLRLKLNSISINLTLSLTSANFNCHNVKHMVELCFAIIVKHRPVLNKLFFQIQHLTLKIMRYLEVWISKFG